ncbi:MAG: CDP-diacylglycerol--glycerol-3-phosphate 3-phosphatidyltransferase [Thermoanaerobaculia bacterium]|nr:CDP-diacylglycerol--glycerol-3-phosphate 3-phosphatidyltransferase [Thermoanaerobaculia bacterium]
MKVPRNLPNLLSIARILLVPLLVVVLLTKFDGKEFVGLGVFLLAAFTDLLDGYVARRFKLETRLGKLLDPAADKILTGAAFISLVELGVAPAWMVVVIVSRELAVSTLRSFAAAENIVIGASWSGKVKTVVQVVTIALLIVYERLGEFRTLAGIALWIAVVVTLYSGIEYYARYGRLILGLPAKNADPEVPSDAVGPVGR